MSWQMRVPVFLLIITSAGLLPGCIGLSIVAGTRQVDQGRKVGQEIGEREAGPGSNIRAEVLRKWGPPNRTFFRHGQEHWVYRKGLTWRGAVGWVIIPLPLLVPVGRHKSRLVFDADTLVRYTTSYGLETSFGFFCGDNECRLVFGRQAVNDYW